MALERCEIGHHGPCVACGALVLSTRYHSHTYLGHGTYAQLCQPCLSTIHRSSAFVLEGLIEFGVGHLGPDDFDELVENGKVGLLIQGDLGLAADPN